MGLFACAGGTCVNRWARRLLLVGLVLVLPMLQPLKAQQAAESDASAQYRIAPLDVLALYGLGTVSPSASQVDCGGLIELPWLGKVMAAGLTANELGGQLNLRYQKHLKDPQVKVQLKESQSGKPVQITGAVLNPGYFQIRERQSLKAALGLAGGLTPRAYGSVQVRRLECNANCDLSSSTQADRCWRSMTYKFSDILNDESLYVEPGNVITATESPVVFVVGQVHVPQILFSRQDLTVTRAIAMVGGVLPNVHGDKARVFRRTADGCFATFEIDLRLIKKRQTEDFRLQGGDIVEVSDKYVKSRTLLLCPDNSDPLRIIR